MVRLVLTLAVLAGACYRVHPIECSITCSEGLCPSDLTCGEDGYCHGAGHTEVCGGQDDARVCSRQAVKVAAGAQHTCAAAADGAVWCWGLNDVGQHGDGTLASKLEPTRLATWPPPHDLAAGASHSCVVDQAGILHCAGQDASGQLGDGPPDTSSSGTFVDVGLAGIEEVAAGADFTCARALGEVYCWGANESGQLGYGMTAPLLAPGQVTGISDATAIDAGDRHACALRGDAGAVSCWGSGYLGNGVLPPGGSSLPVTAAQSGYVQLAAGLNATCGITADGQVACWGSNEDGQCGTGTVMPVLVPTATGLMNAVQVALGPHHSCARLAEGTVWCWGENRFGQLGDGTVRDVVSTPVQVVDLADATDVDVGADFSCAVTGDGRVHCWGNNVAGQLGDGTTRQRSSPILAAFDCTSL